MIWMLTLVTPTSNRDIECKHNMNMNDASYMYVYP